MYYEINVSKMNPNSKRHEHYFATARRSLTDRLATYKLLKHFLGLFPKPEYDITVSYHSEGFTGESAESYIQDYESGCVNKQ
jgi:hypothetical protein